MTLRSAPSILASVPLPTHEGSLGAPTARRAALCLPAYPLTRGRPERIGAYPRGGAGVAPPPAQPRPPACPLPPSPVPTASLLARPDRAVAPGAQPASARPGAARAHPSAQSPPIRARGGGDLRLRAGGWRRGGGRSSGRPPRPGPAGRRAAESAGPSHGAQAGARGGKVRRRSKKRARKVARRRCVGAPLGAGEARWHDKRARKEGTARGPGERARQEKAGQARPVGPRARHPVGGLGPGCSGGALGHHPRVSTGAEWDKIHQTQKLRNGRRPSGPFSCLQVPRHKTRRALHIVSSTSEGRLHRPAGTTAAAESDVWPGVFDRFCFDHRPGTKNV